MSVALWLEVYQYACYEDWKGGEKAMIAAVRERGVELVASGLDGFCNWHAGYALHVGVGRPGDSIPGISARRTVGCKRPRNQVPQSCGTARAAGIGGRGFQASDDVPA